MHSSNNHNNKRSSKDADNDENISPAHKMRRTNDYQKQKINNNYNDDGVTTNSPNLQQFAKKLHHDIEKAKEIIQVIENDEDQDHSQSSNENRRNRGSNQGNNVEQQNKKQDQRKQQHQGRQQKTYDNGDDEENDDNDNYNDEDIPEQNKKIAATFNKAADELTKEGKQNLETELNISRNQAKVIAKKIGHSHKLIESGNDALFLDRIGQKSADPIQKVIDEQNNDDNNNEDANEEPSEGYNLRDRSKHAINNNQEQIPQENIELAEQLNEVADGKKHINIPFSTAKAREMANKIATTSTPIHCGKDIIDNIDRGGAKTAEVVDTLLQEQQGNNNNNKSSSSNRNHNRNRGRGRYQKNSNQQQQQKGQGGGDQRSRSRSRSQQDKEDNSNNDQAEDEDEIILNELHEMTKILKDYAQGKSDISKELNPQKANKFAQELEIICKYVENHEHIRSQLFQVIHDDNE